MAHLLDSSVWVALFLAGDTQHAKAVRLWRSFDGIIFVPPAVIGETVTILAYKHSKEQANNFLEFVEKNADIVIIPENIHESIDFFRTLTARISFTDATLIILSKKHNAHMETFDRQLARLYRRYAET